MARISSSRWVQSSVTSVSFPKTLEDLRNMGLKWQRLIGKDWITDMEVLLDFPPNSNIPWIAPNWLTEGDILFFYHTKTAKTAISKLLKSASGIVAGYGPKASSPSSARDMTGLAEVLRRSAKIAGAYSGAIFGFAEVSGRPQRMHDEYKHFKGTIYAPLGKVYIFNQPLRSEDFTDVLKIGQNTTTPVFGSEFEEIKKRLAERNSLPAAMKTAKSGGLGFRDVNAGNWPEISCRKDARFIDEAQIRKYLLDYILHELRDRGAPVLEECTCTRDGQMTGFADYFVKLNGRWTPIEAKLNILAEEHIIDQVAKYIHIDTFSPTKHKYRGKIFNAEDSPFCMVMDQAGIYLIRDKHFIDCTPDSPIFRRENLTHSAMPEIQKRLTQLMRAN